MTDDEKELRKILPRISQKKMNELLLWLRKRDRWLIRRIKNMYK